MNNAVIMCKVSTVNNEFRKGGKTMLNRDFGNAAEILRTLEQNILNICGITSIYDKL